jgi:NAD(P)-dependent dehydrogenase (short-subunit alcohol dehydrogenase family)
VKLAGRLALVTGGGRGIGRAISLGLAEDGADVAVNYQRDHASALETVEAIRKLGRRAECYAASVDDRDAVRRMVEQLGAELGAPDILVHNAGIASRGLSVAKTDPDELLKVVSVHALGPHFLTGLVLPGMQGKPRGDIVFISSIATIHHQAGGAPYSMGKAAMESLAFTLAKEVRKHNIRVNVVAPGLVETEMGRRLVKGTIGVDDLRKLDATMPFGRVCQPEDVAGVVRFFVSEGASYVTGERIYVHGGGR